jgi:hypothetical protein
MKQKKSYFATENDFTFFNNCTFSSICINFDCLYKNKFDFYNTELSDDILESFDELRNMGYDLYLYNVPESQEVLEWLDKTFKYGFICNEEPTRYADLSDHWNTISRNIDIDLCCEGEIGKNRYFKFEDNWKELVDIIKKNDILAKTDTRKVFYDDIDWEQEKVANGLTVNGKQVLGSSYIPVEKFNEKTTEFLKTIATQRNESPKEWKYKPDNERWYVKYIVWDVNEEIAQKYGGRIEIEQNSLYYRGTWLTIKLKTKLGKYKWDEFPRVLEKFCKDYGFDSRKKAEFRIEVDAYDLPWLEGQKEREEQDDRTDSFF